MSAASRRIDILSLATFVALGLPDGMLGTAWPSMRRTLHAPVGDLGLVLIAYTAGAVAISAVVGGLIRRTGVAALLGAAGVIAAAAAAGFAGAPTFGVVILAGAVSGVAGGLMDSGLNIAVGMSGRRRLLNLLHGFYGVGTMIGPLVVTAAVVSGSWRPAYLVLLVVDVTVALLWLAARIAGEAPAGGPDAASQAEPERAGPAQERRRSFPGAAAAAGVVVFFLYTGLEVSAGQWETTFARDHLHLSASAAGLATFGYWGALTATRIGLALLPRPPRNEVVVRVGTFFAVASAALIWWEPAAGVAIAGFVALGALLAGVFPALVALTPARVGGIWAPRLIAWQIGAATAGGAALSALIGALIEASGLTVLGPALTALAAVVAAGEVLLRRLTTNTCSA